MGQMVDLLEKALELVQDDGELILNETFMMGIFEKLTSKLPPLAEYIQHMYGDKKMALTALPRQKVIPLFKLRQELFFPQSETNQSTSTLVIELGKLCATSILNELRNSTKATAEYLSSMGGKFSCGDISNIIHLGGLGAMAVNDPAESSFGGTTRQIQNFGRIGLTNAGGVDQVTRNGEFSWGYEKRLKRVGK